MQLLCDFHVHSCLSPCASLDASPAAIARAAKAAGLDAVALVDHNSALNVPAFDACCRREGIRALFGMEICSSEEIHCLALFESPEAAIGLGAFIHDCLPDFRNVPDKLGDQPVVDENDVVLEFVDRYLGNATSLRFSELPGLVAAHGGLFVPAHVDRPSFSLLSQLGTIPPEAGPILEITSRRLPEMRARYGESHCLLSFSDAHHPSEIGRAATLVDAESFSLHALRAAFLARRVSSVLRPQDI